MGAMGLVIEGSSSQVSLMTDGGGRESTEQRAFISNKDGCLLRDESNLNEPG